MADEPKPDPQNQIPTAGQDPAANSLSPAPTEVAGEAPGAKAEEDAPPSKPKVVEAEPLSDGTVPTVLKPGDGHRSTVKGKAGLTSIYRKADIITTLFTFAGAVVAGAIIIGVYAYLTRGKAQAPVIAPKVTKLDSSDLNKLGAFFNGNSAGNSAQVLTISSSSLFNNRVAMSSDLKVIGGVDVTGGTTLSDLTVNKTSTLGVTNVRGQLGVSGPLTVQGAAIFNSGATFKGDLSATGNGSFGGSISAGVLNVRDLSVSGTFNLNGHINIGGQQPTAGPASSVASGASVAGSDAAGTVTVTLKPTGALSGAPLATVTFRSTYPRVPTIIITSNTQGGAEMLPYVTGSATGFTISASAVKANINSASYSFSYWVAQ